MQVFWKGNMEDWERQAGGRDVEWESGETWEPSRERFPGLHLYYQKSICTSTPQHSRSQNSMSLHSDCVHICSRSSRPWWVSWAGSGSSPTHWWPWVSHPSVSSAVEWEDRWVSCQVQLEVGAGQKGWGGELAEGKEASQIPEGLKPVFVLGWEEGVWSGSQ